MKKIIVDDKPHVLLEESEYEALQPKPVNTLAGLPVEIHIPFRVKTCSNWDSWPAENTGVMYKNEQISLKLLQWMRDMITAEYWALKKPFVTLSGLQFDNMDLDPDELNKLIKLIEDNGHDAILRRLRSTGKTIVI